MLHASHLHNTCFHTSSAWECLAIKCMKLNTQGLGYAVQLGCEVPSSSLSCPFVFFSSHLPWFHLLYMVLFLKMGARWVMPGMCLLSVKVNAEVTQSHLSYSVVFHSAVRALIHLSTCSNLLSPFYPAGIPVPSLPTPLLLQSLLINTNILTEKQQCAHYQKDKKMWQLCEVQNSPATARTGRYETGNLLTRTNTVRSVLQSEGSHTGPATELGISFCCTH